MRIRGRVAVALAAACLLFGGLKAVQAATPPEVSSVILSRAEGSGRAVVTLVGKGLTKFAAFTLEDSGNQPVAGTVDTLLRSGRMLVLGLPAGIPGGDYTLMAAPRSGALQGFPLAIDAGVAFQGTYGVGSIPVSGQGVRMMWYPGRAAFRAGRVSGTSWDDVNVGVYSASTGYDTTASGQASTATGQGTTAAGLSSTAMGEFTNASGRYSTAVGTFTTAQAFASVVLGRYNVVAGDLLNWVSTDPVLVVGNGDVITASNALTLLKNGNMTIAGTLTENSDGRLKADVAPLSGVLEKIAAIRGVSYRLEDPSRGPAGPQIGLLAQEVRAVFPELVHEDAGGTLSVAYGKFSAVLLEAVKEQQAALEARDRRIEGLEERLARLEARSSASDLAERAR